MGRELPDRCPASLVWRVKPIARELGRLPSPLPGDVVVEPHAFIDTGVMLIDVGPNLHLAEAIVAAHNGVLSGLFGAEAMP